MDASQTLSSDTSSRHSKIVLSGTATSSIKTTPTTNVSNTAVQQEKSSKSASSCDRGQMSSSSIASSRRRPNSARSCLSSPPIKIKRPTTVNEVTGASASATAANVQPRKSKRKLTAKRKLFKETVTNNPTTTTTNTSVPGTSTISVKTSKFYSKQSAINVREFSGLSQRRQPKIEVLELEKGSTNTTFSTATTTKKCFQISSSEMSECLLQSEQEEEESLHVTPTSGNKLMLFKPHQGSDCPDIAPAADHLMKDLQQHSPRTTPNVSNSPSSSLSLFDSPVLACKSPAGISTDNIIDLRTQNSDISKIPAMFRPPPIKPLSTRGNINIGLIKHPVVPPQPAAETQVEQSSACPPSGSSKRRSEIWQYFDSLGDGRLAKCKLCSREVSRGKPIGHLTNSGMKQHMRAHHRPVLLRDEHGVDTSSCTTRSTCSSATSITQDNDVIDHTTSVVASTQKILPHFSKKSQVTIDQFGGFQSKVLSRQQSRKLTRLIAQLIAVGGAPFNLVEGEAFKQLMEAVAPGYQIPSRTTFSRTIVPSLYHSCAALLKAELAKAAGQSVHFTTDLWSAPSGQHAFLSLTAHWWEPKVIQHQEEHRTKDSERKASTSALVNQGHRSFLLHAEVMDEQHTSQNILEALQKMVAHWLEEQSGTGTHSKMGYIVTDGGANMVKAVRDGKYVGVRCSAHLINLVVKNALSEENTSGRLSTLLDSCRKIAGHFHRSVKASNILRKEQRKAGLSEHRLKIDVITRWNSTFDMLERILEQQKALHAMSNEYFIGISIPLGREDWAIIGQLVAVLKPFKALTEKLCQDNSSISEIVPLITHLLRIIDKYLSYNVVLPGGHFPEIIALQKRCKEELTRRLKDITDACPELMLATLCDPRIKGKMALKSSSLTFWRDRLIDRVREKTYKMRRQREDDEEEEEEEVEDSASVLQISRSSETKPKSTIAESFWSDAVDCLVGPSTQPRKKMSSVHDMVTAYLSEPTLPSSDNPLEYWDTKRDIWPVLSKVAQELLSCPPTSVQSERVFSVTGNILSPQRSQLSPMLMEQIAFLKVNLPKLGYPALKYDTEI